MFDGMQTAEFLFFVVLFCFVLALSLLPIYTMLTPALRWRVQSADCAKGRQGTVSVSMEAGYRGHTPATPPTPTCGMCLVVDQFAYGNSNRSLEAAWQY